MSPHTRGHKNDSDVPVFHRRPPAHSKIHAEFELNLLPPHGLFVTHATIAMATSDADIRRCFPVMHQLRPHLGEARYFELARGMVGSGGFRLAFVEDAGAVTAVAGFRLMDMLFSNGKVLYVDDLVTDAAVRSRGHGRALFEWLVQHARDNGCVALTLDSGVQRHDAHRFYLRERMQISAHHFSLEL